MVDYNIFDLNDSIQGFVVVARRIFLWLADQQASPAVQEKRSSGRLFIFVYRFTSLVDICWLRVFS